MTECKLCGATSKCDVCAECEKLISVVENTKPSVLEKVIREVRVKQFMEEMARKR